MEPFFRHELLKDHLHMLLCEAEERRLVKSAREHEHRDAMRVRIGNLLIRRGQALVAQGRLAPVPDTSLCDCC